VEEGGEKRGKKKKKKSGGFYFSRPDFVLKSKGFWISSERDPDRMGKEGGRERADAEV